MNLTKQQLEYVKNGKAVEITAEDTECVLIRKDVYQQLTGRLAGQLTSDSENDVRVLAPLLADLDAEDWEDASNYEK